MLFSKCWLNSTKPEMDTPPYREASFFLWAIKSQKTLQNYLKDICPGKSERYFKGKFLSQKKKYCRRQLFCLTKKQRWQSAPTRSIKIIQKKNTIYHLKYHKERMMPHFRKIFVGFVIFSTDSMCHSQVMLHQGLCFLQVPWDPRVRGCCMKHPDYKSYSCSKNVLQLVK